jgi:hypothetical protein
VFTGHRTACSGTQKNIIQPQEKRGGRLNRTSNTRDQKQTFDMKDGGEGTLDD